MRKYLSDEEVFGKPTYLSDDEVFGEPAKNSKPAPPPAPTNASLPGFSDQMVDDLGGVLNPQVGDVRPGLLQRRMQGHPLDPMIRPEAVEALRSSFASVDEAKRMPMLREIAAGNDGRARAARVILKEEESLQRQERLLAQQNPEMMRAAKSAPGPAGGGSGGAGAPARVRIQDTSPTLGEIADMKSQDEILANRRAQSKVLDTETGLSAIQGRAANQLSVRGGIADATPDKEGAFEGAIGSFKPLESLGFDMSLGDAVISAAKVAPTAVELGAKALAWAAQFNSNEDPRDSLTYQTFSSVAEAAERVNKIFDNAKSREARQRAAELGRTIADPNTSWVDVAGYIIRNPELAAEFAIESSGTMLPALLAAKGAGAAAARLSAKVIGGAAPVGRVGAEIGRVSSAAAGAGAGAANVAMGAGAVYDETLKSGGSVEQANLAAVTTGIGYYLMGRLTGGGAEGALVTGARGAVQTTAREGFQEGGESLSESIAQDLAMGRPVDIESALKQAVPDVVAGIGIGGAVGGSQALADAMPGLQVAREINAGASAWDQRARGIIESRLAGAEEKGAVPLPTAADLEAVARRGLGGERTTSFTPPDSIVAREGITPVTVPVPAPGAPAVQDRFGVTEEEVRAAEDEFGLTALRGSNARVPAVPGSDVGGGGAGGGLVSQGGMAAAGPVPAVDGRDDRGAGGALAGGAAPGPDADGGADPAAVKKAAEAVETAQRQVRAAEALGDPDTIEVARRRLASAQAAATQQATTGPYGNTTTRTGDVQFTWTPERSTNAERLAQVARQFSAAAEARPGLKGQLPADLRPVAPEVAAKFDAISDSVATVLGTSRAVLAESDEMGDGINFAGMSVVNVRGLQKPAVFVAVHENVHQLQDMAARAARSDATPEEKAAAEIWAPMEETIWSMVPQAERVRYAEKALGEKDAAAFLATREGQRTVRREMLADFSAKRLTEPETVNELARRNPAAFGAFAKKMVSYLGDVIKALRGSRRGLGANDVDAYVKDLQQAKAVWQDAMLKWAARGGAKAQPAAGAQVSESARNDKPFTHEVYDRKTGEVVGKYTTKSGARLARDKRDLQYGAVRYAVREIAPQQPSNSARISPQRQQKIDEAAAAAREYVPGYAVDDAVALVEQYPGAPEMVVPDADRARLEAEITPLIDRAKALQPGFKAQVEALSGRLSAKPKVPGVKGLKRAAEKMYQEEREQGRSFDPAWLKDLVRGTIVVESMEEVAQAIEAAREAFNVTRVKDRFSKPTEAGYRDVLMNVDLGGMPAELQIHIPEMLAAKELGHLLYEVERSLPNGDEKTRLQEAQAKFYGAAFDAATGAEPALSQRLSSDRNSSRETASSSSSFSSTTPVMADLGDSPGSRTTGSSSLAKNLAPSGNSLGSITSGSIRGTSAPADIVNRQGPSNSARSIEEHKMVVERAERATIKTVRLSTAESALVDKSAEEIAAKTGAQVKGIKAAIKAELTRKKAAYPASAGWAPLDFKGAKAEVDEDGKVIMGDDGQPVLSLEYDAIPYSFHVGASGKADAATEGVRAEAMAMRLKKHVMDLVARREKGDGAAEVMLRQAGWYKNMRQRLRAEFGGFGDFVADLLGATSPNTPVRTNWEFTIEALKMASDGRYDDIMPAIGEWWTKYTAARDAEESYLAAQLAAGKKKVDIQGKKAKGGGWERQPDPVYEELRQRTKGLAEYTGPQPRRENGKRYGINTMNVLSALGDLWRVVEKGSAPKARNFSGNLIGFRKGATIDVWAARLLRRVANEVIAKGAFPRVPPPAEKGVGGNHLSQDDIGGEFGFGQKVFNKAADMLRRSGVEDFKNIGDDDLQAIVWFLEKELWTKNNWTTVAGEGGSFEQEADLAGSMDRDTIKELRRVIDSTKSSPEMKDAARRELAKYEGTLQRFTGGLSIQRSAELQGANAVPTDDQMAAVRQELEAAAAAPEVVAFRAFSTIGRYGGDERSFDVEGVTRQGYDLMPLHRKMREVAKREGQDSFFTAKALQPGDTVDLTVHRPGLEIYFSQPIEMADAEPMLAQLRERGVEFFTFITDGRRTPRALAGAMPKVTGVRMLALPEFMARYGDAEAAALASASDEQIVSYMQQRQDEFINTAEAVRNIPGVSYAEVGHYEVNAEFKEQYDGNQTGRPQGAAGAGGVEAWSGRLVRAAVALANPGDGAAGAAGLQAGAGDLRGLDGATVSNSARSDAAGDRRDRGVPEGPEQGRQAYGVATPGAAAPVEAYHFSREPRSSLSSAAYGTGLRGAEAERLRGADPRLSQRVYFYFNQGTGIRPESGVGAHAHRVTLRNLYDAAEGRIRGAGNDFELAVLEAGYDGYMVRLQGQQSGQAVLLGRHTVPVEYLGTGAPTQAAQAPAAPARARREGDELVSSAQLDAPAIRAKADVQAVAPSFRFEFGKARVKAAEAELANEVLAAAGSAVSFSRRLRDDLEQQQAFLNERARAGGYRDLDEFADQDFEGFMKAAEEWRAMNPTDEMVSASLRLVDPGSVLNAAVTRAADAVEKVLTSGRAQKLSLGRTPHVLSMLGAQPRVMEMDESVVRKVFFEKHLGKLKGIEPRAIVEGLYRPAMVFKQKGVPNEFELVLPVATAGGPLTATIVVDRDRAAVKSIYPRSWLNPLSGPGVREFFTQSSVQSKPVYVDEYLSAIAATGNENARAQAGIGRRAGSPSDQRPGVNSSVASAAPLSPAQTPVGSGKKSIALPGRPVNREHFISWSDFRLISGKYKVPGEADLMRWIGDNFRGDWADAPSYSGRTLRSIDEGSPESEALREFGYTPTNMPALMQAWSDGARVFVSSEQDDGVSEVLSQKVIEAGGFPMDRILVLPPGVSQSGRLGSSWKDELGRVQFGPGAVAFNAAAKIANRVLNKFALKPIDKDLGRAIRKMKVEIERAQNLSIDVSEKLGKLSDAERQMISDVIEGELKAGVKPPKKILAAAASISRIMSDQSAELVRLGMLDQNTASAYDGAYLPRFYEKHLGDEAKGWAKAAKRLLSRPGAMQGIKGNSLRARGIFKDIPVSELADWQAQGWMERDPNRNPADETVRIWRDFTRQEREQMGEIRDASFRFVMGYMRSQKDIALGRLYESLASSIAQKRQPLEGEWVQVPATNVGDGVNVRRYGKLAGMWVPAEVMDHLGSQDRSFDNELLQIYRKGLSMWKEGKVVLNPVSHANNVISNLITAHFAGVSMWDAHKYALAARDLIKRDPMVTEAQEAGLFGGTFSTEELAKNLPDQLKILAQKQETALARGIDKTWTALSLFLRKPAGIAYEAEDKFFRYLVYRDARKNGLSPDDAVDYAQKFVFAYDDLPRGARVIRDTALPFFSYTYKAIPMLAETALKYPWRYAFPAALVYGANAAAYAIAAAAGEDDDLDEIVRRYFTDPEFRAKAQAMEKEESENLPPWMQGYGMAMGVKKTIRLGMDETTDLPVFLDVARWIPGGDIFDLTANAGGLPLPAPLTPGNPLLTLFTGLIGNKDLFTGKDLVNKQLDSDAEAAFIRGQWAWRQITPAVAPMNYHFDRILQTIAAHTDQPITLGPFDYTGTNRDGLPAQASYTAMQTFGVKARPIDLEMSSDIKDGQTKALIREIDAEMRRIRRLMDKGAMSDEAGERALERERTKKDRLRDGMDVDGDPRP